MVCIVHAETLFRTHDTNCLSVAQIVMNPNTSGSPITEIVAICSVNACMAAHVTVSACPDLHHDMDVYPKSTSRLGLEMLIAFSIEFAAQAAADVVPNCHTLTAIMSAGLLFMITISTW